jgi:4-carboxymuconolactone decarboxylase
MNMFLRLSNIGAGSYALYFSSIEAAMTKPAPLSRAVVDPELAHRLRHFTEADGSLQAVFLVLAHNPLVTEQFRAATIMLLRDGTVPVRHRELLILRTVFRCGADAEWATHVRLFATAAGLSERELAALAHTDIPGNDVFDPTERDLIALADELYSGASLTPTLRASIVACHGLAMLVEIIAIVMHYRWAATMAGVAGVQRADGNQGFTAI